MKGGKTMTKKSPFTMAIIVLWLCIWTTSLTGAETNAGAGTNNGLANRNSQKENTPPPPGTVIDYSRNWENCYLGTPSMELLSDGTLVASHDWFGTGSGGQHTTVFESKDKGKSWQQTSEFPQQNSSTLFRINNDTLYMIGYCCPAIKGKSGHCIAIRRSNDGGKTWTVPLDEKSGLLFSDDSYYSDPVPILVHQGRIWWQVDVEADSKGKPWPSWFKMAVISAPIDCDLLDASNWTRSNTVDWPGGDTRFNGWLEGNVLVDLQGNLLVLARLESVKEPIGTHVARLELSADGKTLSFDPKVGILEFPGGSSKFCIRFDDVSKRYWSLTNWVPPGQKGKRNTLALVSSPDLKNWTINKIIYQHTDPNTGFQYIDWRFVGNDIFFVCRLAWFGFNFHDSNYLTFDTISDFRNIK